MDTSPSHLIANRRSEIERQLSELAMLTGRLREELKELEMAERVLARLSGEARASTGEGEATSSHRAGTTKPEGTPTVPEMILTLLEEVKDHERRPGLEPKEMVQKVAERWWPEVKPEAIGSIAWRMWKRKQLRKEGSIYMLPETNKGPDASTPEPSGVLVPQPHESEILSAEDRQDPLGGKVGGT